MKKGILIVSAGVAAVAAAGATFILAPQQPGAKPKAGVEVAGTLTPPTTDPFGLSAAPPSDAAGDAAPTPADALDVSREPAAPDAAPPAGEAPSATAAAADGVHDGATLPKEPEVAAAPAAGSPTSGKNARPAGFEGVRTFDSPIADDADTVVNGKRAGKTHQLEDDPAYVFEQRRQKFDPVVNGLATAGDAPVRSRGERVRATPTPVSYSGTTDPQDIPRTIDADTAAILARASDGVVVHTDFAKRSSTRYTAMIRWGNVRPTLSIETSGAQRAVLRVSGAHLGAPLPRTLLRGFTSEPTQNGVRFIYSGKGKIDLTIEEGSRSAIITVADHGAAEGDAAPAPRIAPAAGPDRTYRATAPVTGGADERIGILAPGETWGPNARRTIPAAYIPPGPSHGAADPALARYLESRSSTAPVSSAAGWRVHAVTARSAVVTKDGLQYPVTVGSVLPGAGLVTAVDVRSSTVTTESGPISR